MIVLKIEPLLFLKMLIAALKMPDVTSIYFLKGLSNTQATK